MENNIKAFHLYNDTNILVAIFKEEHHAKDFGDMEYEGFYTIKEVKSNLFNVI